VKLIHSYSSIKFKLIFFVFLLGLVFTFCNSEQPIVVENICGEAPNNFIEPDIKNNPNYVFEPDSNFPKINLEDKDGNTATVNSYEECYHYVKGGWKKPPPPLINFADIDLENLFLRVFLIVYLIITIIYFKSFKKDGVNFKQLLNYLPFIFFSYIFFNIYSKLLERGLYFPTLEKKQLIKYFSLLVAMALFFLLGNMISGLFNLKSASLAISYFLISFFLVDYIFIPLTKYIAFDSIFLITLMLWFTVFLLSKKISNVKVLLLSFLFSILYYFNKLNYFYLLDNGEYKILNSDVNEQWLPLISMLNSNNLFFALENNLIDGYDMLLTYLQLVVHKILFFDLFFEFSTLIPNLIYLFALFIFFDLNIKNRNKLLLTSIYLLIILDDGWLRFLMANSVMLEPLVSFLFASFVINFNYPLIQQNKIKLLTYIFIFSSLTLSKQFIESIVFLLIIYLFFKVKSKKIVLLGLVPIFINIFYNSIYFNNANIVYIDKPFSEILLDIVLLNDPEWRNINLIFDKLIEFNYVLIMIVLGSLFYLLNNLNSKSLETYRYAVFFSIIINFAMVNLLYLFIWQSIEIDSSFRYISNTLHLIFIYLFIEFDSYQKNGTLSDTT